MSNICEKGKFELASCNAVSAGMIEEFLHDFSTNGERCNVLWRLYEIDAEEWQKEIADDTGTSYFSFTHGSRIIGICRVTRKPKYEANGMLGYAICPSERGNHLGAVMIGILREKCITQGMTKITACVDCRNIPSRKTLEAAGWRLTGRRFEWRPDPMPRTALEYCT